MASRYPTSLFEGDFGRFLLTWIECADRQQLEQYQPWTQAYGVCFNNAGEILIIDERGNGSWKIPGGTPEPGETPEQTLARELMEEADVELGEVIPLGVQQVQQLFPDQEPGSPHYQWRFTGRISVLHPQTPDPATGKMYPRKFVPADQINKTVQWGETGAAIFAAAIRRMKK
jgi:8-oxo-dGTP pyrophosphatase MutT (NUDIX family)